MLALLLAGRRGSANERRGVTDERCYVDEGRGDGCDRAFKAEGQQCADGAGRRVRSAGGWDTGREVRAGSGRSASDVKRGRAWAGMVGMISVVFWSTGAARVGCYCPSQILGANRGR
jgi:hypothetical protein